MHKRQFQVRISTASSLKCKLKSERELQWGTIQFGPFKGIEIFSGKLNEQFGLARGEFIGIRLLFWRNFVENLNLENT